MTKALPILLVAFCLFAPANPLDAQWVQANRPNVGVIQCFADNGTNLFAVTSAGEVWRRPLSEIITAVERRSADLPAHFGLEQNYPNPFNPATTISFTLPSRSFVALKVFDASGREVSILVSEELSSGTHVRQWNAAGLASGVYFLRLKAGSFIQTKKLALLR